MISSWGCGNIIFENTICTWVFKYLVPKVAIFWRISGTKWNMWAIIRKFQKPDLIFKNWIFKFDFETHVHRVTLKIILALTNFQIDIFGQAHTVFIRGPGQNIHARPEGPSLRMDEMGWCDGWCIKSVLWCASYFL